MSSPILAPPASPLDAVRKLKSVLARQGSIVATYRTYNGRKLGPYYRLAYRTEGRQRSLYLGKSKKIVRQVRRLLEKIQKSRNIRRSLHHGYKNLEETMKKHWAQIQVGLLKVGLQFRGFDIRGWRRYRRLLQLQRTPGVPYQGLRNRILHLLSFPPPTRGSKSGNCPFSPSVVQKTHETLAASQ
ncbi:MAG: DUF1678 domain-containing protein [Pirellulales bacterium]|nr:DUF1678 domain-containing protein [Pirellulales bacterium]